MQFNPMQFITMMKNGQNPEQLMLNFLAVQASGNPMMENLLAMAKNYDVKGIEEIVRNICANNGVDFEKEFNAFKRSLGLK